MEQSNLSEQVLDKKKENKNKQPLIIFFMIILWIALVFGGYWFIENTLDEHRQKMQSYVDNSIKKVQETNAMNIKQLQEEIKSIRFEIEKVSHELDEADESLEDSESSREKLNQKIQKLDKKLNDLKKSLEMLKESPQ